MPGSTKRIFFGEGDGDERQAGVTLAGGQWQPSSGLDAESGHAVHLGLRRHRAGRTSVLISHRLGALRGAGLIVVLSEGKIRERGSHGGLMALGGEYARLFRLQAGAYERAPEPSAGPGAGESLRTTTPSTWSTGR
ncbi:hypothetical protein SMD20_40850 [Nonomuraea sp. LP-02]|uniref:hypothetical protein n=1 Tax=Nonomuraea sp. LP-02 TaxID=3097960 RepID=UPI002E30A5AB|nr:hypothetical protein [Nonomuraea sp. LP-02]MED7930632.1 hypothetical protein [Nonomuraea sp. LP-02]